MSAGVVEYVVLILLSMPIELPWMRMPFRYFGVYLDVVTRVAYKYQEEIDRVRVKAGCRIVLISFRLDICEA